MDGLPYEVYKLAHPSMVTLLTDSFNQFYSNPDTLPHYFGSSSISLLHKKDDISNPANFRPISLLPTVWKLFSSVLTNRLNQYICEIISPEQVGFVKGRNIESCLHTIDSIILECPESYLVAVDFEKAFDSLSLLFTSSSGEI